MKEKIIEKIQNLLDLAGNNPNRNEALAASLKAQQLMAKYDIELADLDSDGTEQEIGEVMVTCSKDGITFKKGLAAIIAENFRCRSFALTTKIQNQIVFYGYKQDAQIASQVYIYLYRTGIRLSNREAKKVRDLGLHFSRSDYLIGFAQGVKKELGKQCRALMLVVPKEVEDGFQDLIKGCRKPRKYYYRQDYEFNQGMSAGVDAARARYLETTEV